MTSAFRTDRSDSKAPITTDAIAVLCFLARFEHEVQHRVRHRTRLLGKNVFAGLDRGLEMDGPKMRRRGKQDDVDPGRKTCL